MKDKMEHILEVAEELFAEYGYEGTSVRELAAKAKVNVAMISYYFGSKEDLMEALFVARSGYLREKLTSISQAAFGPEKKIEMLVDFYVHRILDMNRFHKILQHEMSLQQRSRFNDTIHNNVIRNKDLIRSIIEEGQKKKIFRKVDVDLTMATLIGTISHVVLAAHFACQLFPQKVKGETIFTEGDKDRLKKHLKSVIKSHLMLPSKIRKDE